MEETRTTVLAILTHKTKPNQFCLRIKPKTPKEEDNQVMMIIRHDLLWFSWKYELLNTPCSRSFENEWRCVADVLEIFHADFAFSETDSWHLKSFFELREKRLFSTKFDVCKDIYMQIRNHDHKCCGDIVTVTQIENLPSETVYWVGDVMGDS